MYAGTWKTDQYIAFLDFLPVQKIAFIHGTHTEAGNIIMLHIIHIRHFGSFPADQGTLCLHTAIRYTLYQLFDFLRFIFAYCQIIQEEDRCCPLYQNIIDTHCHSINTNCVMLIHFKCHKQLCTNTIGSAYQNRFLHV